MSENIHGYNVIGTLEEKSRDATLLERPRKFSVGGGPQRVEDVTKHTFYNTSICIHVFFCIYTLAHVNGCLQMVTSN